MLKPAWHEPPLPRWFADEGFQSVFEALLAATRHGGADAVEVLETAARVCDGDASSWVEEWVAAAGHAWELARAAEERYPISAREHFLRAGTYYGVAAELAWRSAEPDREAALRERRHACWERSVRGLAEPLGSVGHFFGATAGERRALVIVDTSGGCVSDAWNRAGVAAFRRGHNWLSVEPDADGTLGLSRVLDTLGARADVDAKRIAVVGGASLPLALAREHRLAAAVVDPAVPVARHVIDAVRTPLLLCGPQARLVSPDAPRLDDPASPSVRKAQIFDSLAGYIG
jgi:hypothetical protein